MATARRSRGKRTADNSKPFSNDPSYALRLSVKRASDWQIEIWQLPSPATPRLKAPEHVASLKGTPLRMIERRVIKRLSRVKINLGVMRPGKKKEWPLELSAPSPSVNRALS